MESVVFFWLLQQLDDPFPVLEVGALDSHLPVGTQQRYRKFTIEALVKDMIDLLRSILDVSLPVVLRPDSYVLFNLSVILSGEGVNSVSQRSYIFKINYKSIAKLSLGDRVKRKF